MRRPTSALGQEETLGVLEFLFIISAVAERSALTQISQAADERCVLPGNTTQSNVRLGTVC